MNPNPFETGLLRYYTASELKKIQSVRVGVAGAGGLGSNCAALLARSGFKRLTVVDFDAVDASNLNRQNYVLSQLGRPKVEALAETLRQINPDIAVVARNCKIDGANARALFRCCDILVEALDRAEEKKMFVETFLNEGKFLVAASGIAGCGASDRIATHRIKKNFYIVGDLESGVDQAPPLAPCVAIAAAKQADLVLARVLRGDGG